MIKKNIFKIFFTTSLFIHISCAHPSKRMPSEIKNTKSLSQAMGSVDCLSDKTVDITIERKGIHGLSCKDALQMLEKDSPDCASLIKDLFYGKYTSISHVHELNESYRALFSPDNAQGKLPLFYISIVSTDKVQTGFTLRTLNARESQLDLKLNQALISHFPVDTYSVCPPENSTKSASQYFTEKLKALHRALKP